MIYQLNAEYSLRPLAASDLDGPYVGWFEDQEVCRYNSHGKFFRNRAYFEDYFAQLNNEDRIVLAICHAGDGHIGNVSLLDISRINRTAEFAIILGDRRHWHKGVGLLAGAAIIDHGFRKLDLERIHCGTAATNMGMRKLAEDLGMTVEGTRRQHLFLEGARVDLLEYGLLRPEFRHSAS